MRAERMHTLPVAWGFSRHAAIEIAHANRPYPEDLLVRFRPFAIASDHWVDLVGCSFGWLDWAELEDWPTRPDGPVAPLVVYNFLAGAIAVDSTVG